MSGKLSRTTTSPGLRVLSQLSLDVSFKNAPVHRRANDEGSGQGVASQAGDEGLRLPVSERDFRKQPLPLRSLPRRRVILVVVPGLRPEISRWCCFRFTIGWRVKVHSSRVCFLSGRSCSLARRAYFEAIAGMRMSQRGSKAGSAFSRGGGGQFGRQLRHGDVGLLGDLLQKKRPMRFMLGVAAASPLAGLNKRLPAHERHSPG